MILLSLLFNLGVRFAIFNFIWFFLELLLKLLTGMRQQSLLEHYILKAIKYVILVSITFAYCLDLEIAAPAYVLNWQKLVPGGLILMLYLLGRFQKQEEQIQFLAGFQMPLSKQPYARNLEILLLVLAAALFTGLFFYPNLTEIGLLQWFESNIRSLEKAFLLGFIFKVLGFFFVLNVFFRLLKAFSPNSRKQGPDQDQNTEEYTAYEEVSDKQLD
jgi:hypothetical protein